MYSRRFCIVWQVLVGSLSLFILAFQLFLVLPTLFGIWQYTLFVFPWTNNSRFQKTIITLHCWCAGMFLLKFGFRLMQVLPPRLWSPSASNNTTDGAESESVRETDSRGPDGTAEGFLYGIEQVVRAALLFERGCRRNVVLLHHLSVCVFVGTTRLRVSRTFERGASYAHVPARVAAPVPLLGYYAAFAAGCILVLQFCEIQNGAILVILHCVQWRSGVVC